MQVFRITKVHEDAAQLLANGELTDTQIADESGVTRQTLWNWKQHPEFAALVDGHLARFREEVRRRGLANPDRRIRALNDRWNRLHRVIEARADDPGYAEAPGGTTGLLARTHRKLGEVLIEEFAVDTGLLREIREHEKQAAQELGQWVERQEVDQTVRGQIGLAAAMSRLSIDELNMLDAVAQKVAGTAGGPPPGDPGGEVPA